MYIVYFSHLLFLNCYVPRDIFILTVNTKAEKKKFKDPVNITERWGHSYKAAFYLLEPREGEREDEKN